LDIESIAAPRRELRLRDPRSQTVWITFAVAAVLSLLWRFLLATTGGDIAAQDAWAEFARVHPGSAYNLSWYGGMHPVSYSVISPYLMAWVGVRTTMVLSTTMAATLSALLLVRLPAVKRPLWPSLAVAVAMFGNAISGRVTFALGTMFAVAALGAVVTWPEAWRRYRVPRALIAATMAMLSTFGSPVAGFFLGLVAVALWLRKRRAAAYVLGIPPALVVLLAAVVFPFSGKQPMHWDSAILPILIAIFVWLVFPTSWWIGRLTALIYVVAVLFAWLVPSPIGTNVVRLSLIYGTTALLVAVCSDVDRNPFRFGVLARLPRRTFVTLAIITTLIWQGSVAGVDAVHSHPDIAWTVDTKPLIHQLEKRGAKLGRVEVVPSRSHRESSALAPYANLARGWNRQADAERNPVFYDQQNALTATTYKEWLHRWAVHYVILPPGDPDGSALAEAHLVETGLPYLKLVWSNRDWQLYRVLDATPLADPPATVTKFDSAEIVLTLPHPATVLVRIPASPWLSLVNADGTPVPAPSPAADGQQPVNVQGCLTRMHEPAVPGRQQPADDWTVLHAPTAGTYRIAAPYKLPRGTSCPDDLENP
jgi:MFS family permease